MPPVLRLIAGQQNNDFESASSSLSPVANHQGILPCSPQVPSEKVLEVRLDGPITF